MKNKEKFTEYFSGLPIRVKILLSIVSVLFLVMVTFISLTINYNQKLVLQVSKSEIINFTQLSAEAMGFGLETQNLEYIRNIVNRMKKEPRLSSLLILDNESNIIAGLNSEGLKKEKLSGLLNQREPVVKDEKICWAFPIRGYNSQTLKEKNLGSVIVEFSLKSVNQKIFHEQIRLLLIAFGVLVVGVAISILLARQISQPIARLVELSNKIGETGNYSLRAEKKSGGELGLLENQYNKMLSQIQKQNEVMVNLNESLELRVKDRTLDLEKAKEEAETANRAKTDFLSRMSHELRTPLNAILGFSQLLKIKGWEALPDNKKENENFVEHILSAGNHLLSLINEVLTLSQIESGAFALNLEPVDISRLAGEVKGMLQPMAQKYNVELNLSLLPEKHVVVKADPKRVRQVLTNLVSNAIKYNRPHGRVDIWIEIQAETQMTLKVKDTGLGIAPSKAEAIFLPFERLEWEFSSVEGIGIGLSISKNLIEAMGGTIGFESELDKGSTFYFSLPLYSGELLNEKPAGQVS